MNSTSNTHIASNRSGIEKTSLKQCNASRVNLPPYRPSTFLWINRHKSSPQTMNSNVNEDSKPKKNIRRKTRWLNFPSYLPFLVVVSIAAICTRFYNLNEPAHVCWDETHFGKMASWYLNRTFFFDVHPPLGKMLIALSGYLSGYDGGFAFDKPGDVYENHSQYLGMRVFCATAGFLIVPFVFIATLSISRSIQSASIASTLVLFDNGMITLTRYILLDPPLLFFVTASFMGMAKFSFEYGPENSKLAFTTWWWFWLFWTGTFIAAAFSVKFVGLFIVLLVGLRTAYDLWLILGDMTKPIVYFVKHLLARVILLIMWPVALYIIFFWIHLKQLDCSGNGDGFYSSAFQSQLKGNSLYNASWPAHLAYGSVVTIKNNRIGGAYLHSHWHLYPEGVGAKQQQVTTYSHKDSNNKWLVKKAFKDQLEEGEDVFIRDNDLIRLEHVVTKRNLHSHFEQAPITKRHYQVTCYGQDGTGDANDIWKVVKDKSRLSEKGEYDRIYTVRSRFRLVHQVSNCALHSHSKQLPKWAYEQLEVTCNPRLHDKNNFWNIEDNYYPKLPNVSFEEYAPSFIERFLESHAVMFQGNAGLKPKEGEVTSRPWQWPLNYRGQFFSASNGQKIYLLGNPIIWWSNIVTIPLSIIIILILLVTKERKKLIKLSVKKLSNLKKQLREDETGILKTYWEAATWVLIGWLIHYVPFYFMGRILYFHHYFPAFIFSCTLTAITYDYFITLLNNFFQLSRSQYPSLQLTGILMTFVIYTFAKFIPITYGTKDDTLDLKLNGTIESWRNNQYLSSLKWLDSWEF